MYYMHSVLIDLIIFSSAAVIVVPLFKWLNLGPILAYLFAGMLIGPSILGLVGDPQVILHFSELGVVFLLFVIGLELAPSKLWKLRRSIFGMGLAQVVITGLIFYLVGRELGLTISAAYVCGFGLALSSTAFTLQVLEEKRQLNTTHGQGSFSILMFQDLAVVPILASLALFEDGQGGEYQYLSLIYTVLALLGLVIAGRYLIRYIFRLVAESGSQEVFTAMSLLTVLGTAILLESVGLSMGMGAFLAGVLLANSEYRHELESNLMPFKGLLLGLFFIAVGMSLDLLVLLQKPHWVLLLTLSFMSVKTAMIWLLARIFGFPKESSRNMAFTLPQGGEFAFVLFSTALAKGLLTEEQSSILGASVTISMALTPLVFSLNQKWLRPNSDKGEVKYDKIESEEPEVIIAGYGRFGQIVARFLSTEGVKFTILEHSAAQVETARKFGMKVYYGDASRLDILEAAGAKSAKILVLAIDDVEKSTSTAKMVKSHFPQLEIIARVRNRQHALDMFQLGVQNAHRETYLTSLEVAKEVLLFKGIPRERINRRLAKFRAHDEKILREQLKYRHDEKQFISFTNQANEELRQILNADKEV